MGKHDSPAETSVSTAEGTGHTALDGSVFIAQT